MEFLKNINESQGGIDLFSYSPLNYPIINLNKENTILLITLFRGEESTILLPTFGVSKISSNNLTIEKLENVYGQLTIKVDDSLDRFSCFMTEKKLIECFYVENDLYTVAIFEKNYTYCLLILIH